MAGIYIPNMSLPDKEHRVLLELDCDGNAFAAYDGGVTKMVEHKAHFVPHSCIELPCSIGETVYIIARCKNVRMHLDRDTGYVECPYETECFFDVCDDNNLRVFEDRCMGFHFDGELHAHFDLISLPDEEIVFGKTVFLSREDAEKNKEEENV